MARAHHCENSPVARAHHCAPCARPQEGAGGPSPVPFVPDVFSRGASVSSPKKRLLYKQRFLPKPGQGNGAGGTRRGRQPARPAPRPLCHFAQLPLIPALKSPHVAAADGLGAGLPGSARVGCKQGLSIGFGGASESSGSSQSRTSVLPTPQRLLEMGAAGLRS